MLPMIRSFGAIIGSFSDHRMIAPNDLEDEKPFPVNIRPSFVDEMIGSFSDHPIIGRQNGNSIDSSERSHRERHDSTT